MVETAGYGGVFSLWWVGLPEPATAPTADGGIGLDAAGVFPTGRERDELALGRNRLAPVVAVVFVVVAPAANGLVNSDSAVMAGAGREGDELALGRNRLARIVAVGVVVVAPAANGLVNSDSARMTACSGDGSELAIWGVGLVEPVVAPAANGLVNSEGARMELTALNGEVFAWRGGVVELPVWCRSWLLLIPLGSWLLLVLSLVLSLLMSLAEPSRPGYATG